MFGVPKKANFSINFYKMVCLEQYIYYMYVCMYLIFFAI